MKYNFDTHQLEIEGKEILKILSDRLKQEFKDSHLRNQELIINQNKIIIELLSNDYNVPETINKLIKSQKPLGDEFSKVLYDNLWDLYLED